MALALFYPENRTLKRAHESKDTISKEMQDWANNCPNKEMLTKMLQDHVWYETFIHCPECGEKFLQKDLIVDSNGPYSDGQQLICKDCWHSNNIVCKENGMPIQKKPVYGIPPSNFGIKMTKPIYGIFRTGKKIGTVENYNAIFHTGRVTLFGMEDCAETGPLDPCCEVRDEDNAKIGPGDVLPNPIHPVCMEEEVVVSFTLADILPL